MKETLEPDTVDEIFRPMDENVEGKCIYNFTHVRSLSCSFSSPSCMEFQQRMYSLFYAHFRFAEN